MEGDLARQLPDPPPPRPAQRTAALAAALDRFEGAEVGPRPPRSAPGVPWWRTGRGRIGAFASAVLAALIGVPLALQHPRLPTRPTADEPASAKIQVAPQPPSATAPADMAAPPAAASADPAASRSSGTAGAPLLAGRAAPPAAIAGPTVEAPPSPAPAVMAAPPPPPPPPAPSAPAPPPPPPEALARAPDLPGRVAEADEDGGSIVVTGSRVSRGTAAASRRGDWNACTVDDPERSLRGCKGLVRNGAKGSAGAAGSAMAEGLSLAWRGEWEEAVSAFDRALALEPRLGFAYLNRGLTYQHLGDMPRAAADLDRAVHYASSARSYYHRGTVRRLMGNRRGAEADAARAVKLDSDYAALVGD